MAEYVALWWRLLGSRMRSQAQYRASFWLQMLGQALLIGTDFFVILVLFGHLHALGGWTLFEIGFLYGIASIGSRTADMFFGQVENVGSFIRTGQFDTFLVRPLGSLLQTVTSDFGFQHIGSLAQGAVVLAVSLAKLDIEWTILRMVVVVVAIPCAGAIFCAVWVVTNAISFWLTDAREAANAFTYGGGALAEYPIHIYGRWFRRILAFVVPAAFVCYFPALYVLDKPDPLGLPRWAQFSSPAVAAAAALVAAGVWRYAVRHYRSTGH